MADVRTQKKIGEGHHDSALKRSRQNLKHRASNRAILTALRTQIKKLRTPLDAKNKAEAEKWLKPTLALVARMGNKQMIHPNKAARLASRLTRQFNRLG